MIKHGWLNIDKPVGITSMEVCRQVKRLLKIKKVGHAGTLDPFASGVLPIAFGEATKTIQFAQDSIKEYMFTLQFGAETDTEDSTGKITERCKVYPNQQEIEAVLKHFTGKIDQVPPAYSALKIGGKRAYALARAGEIVDMPSRQVDVYSITLEVVDDTHHKAIFRVTCGKGTYIRSLGRDIARKLDSCGYVVQLRRTKVGVFDEKNIISLAKLKEIVHNGEIERVILPPWKVLDDISAVNFSQDNKQKIIHGRAVELPAQEAFTSGSYILARVDDKPIAIGKIEGQLFQPKRVFNFNN